MVLNVAVKVAKVFFWRLKIQVIRWKIKSGDFGSGEGMCKKFGEVASRRSDFKNVDTGSRKSLGL